MMQLKRHVGYIGLGLMGGAMARHLVDTGWPLTVYDVRPEAMEDLAEFGAERADSPRAVAEATDLVITSLPNPSDVEAVALGADGIIHGIRPGQVYIDMSTVDPATTRKVGAEIERPVDARLGEHPLRRAGGAGVLGHRRRP